MTFNTQQGISSKIMPRVCGFVVDNFPYEPSPATSTRTSTTFSGRKLQFSGRNPTFLSAERVRVQFMERCEKYTSGRKKGQLICWGKAWQSADQASITVGLAAATTTTVDKVGVAVDTRLVATPTRLRPLFHPGGRRDCATRQRRKYKGIETAFLEKEPPSNLLFDE